MKTRFLVVPSLVLLAAFAACNKETTTDTAGVTTSTSIETVTTTVSTTTTTEVAAVTDTTMTTVAIPAPSSAGTEQIKEGAKQIGKGLKEEARQAVAVAGAAMERGGEKLQQKAAEAAPQTAPAAGNVANGASVFKAKCVACHGADASGNTAIGRKNSIADLRSPAVQGMSDAQLATMIKNGKPGGMSAGAHKSKALTEDHVTDVIAYLRSIR